MAAHHAVTVAMLDKAFTHVDEAHVLPLLCVVDVVLKFSTTSRRAVNPHIPRWLRVLPVLKDPRFFDSAEALVMQWVHHGAVDGACVASFLERYKSGRETHACAVCGFRFDSASRRDGHMDAHVAAGLAHLVSRMRTASTSLGLFAEFEERRRVRSARSKGLPDRPCSPISPPDAEVGTATCAVCGDVCVKSFSETCNAFVFEGCSRDSEGALVHAECGGSAHVSTAFFRVDKKQKTIQ